MQSPYDLTLYIIYSILRVKIGLKKILKIYFILLIILKNK